MVYIHLEKPSQNYSVAVFSVIGQQLIKTSNNPAVDISNVANGIYIIKVSQEGKIWTARIVKQ